jgi:hypothetical protein
MTTTNRSVFTALALALSTVAVWWAWLGHDTEYDVDPVTMSETGPYSPAQVIACVLSLGVLAAVGGLLARPWLVMVTMTVSFTIAWAAQAAATDDSGLWPVGAVLVAAGTSAGTVVVSAVADAIRRSRSA